MNKNELLFQMMEQPQLYTAEEWQEILSDEECREIYTLMAKTKSAFDSQKEIDDKTIDIEWKKLTLSSRRNWLRVAAMFIGVLMLSGIAYAAYRMVGSMGGDYKSPTQETRIANSRQQDKTEEAKDSTAMKPVVYEDAELATILNEIATFHQCEVVYKSEASKHIRLYFTWDQKATIDDIIGTFNKFERIHITRDNKKLIVE